MQQQITFSIFGGEIWCESLHTLDEFCGFGGYGSDPSLYNIFAWSSRRVGGWWASRKQWCQPCALSLHLNHLSGELFCSNPFQSFRCHLEHKKLCIMIFEVTLQLFQFPREDSIFCRFPSSNYARLAAGVVDLWFLWWDVVASGSPWIIKWGFEGFRELMTMAKEEENFVWVLL